MRSNERVENTKAPSSFLNGQYRIRHVADDHAGSNLNSGFLPRRLLIQPPSLLRMNAARKPQTVISPA